MSSQKYYNILKIMQYTLTYVKPEQKVSAKTGKPYTIVTIKTQETADAWISGFGNKESDKWQGGDKVDLDVYTEDYNGKTYTKFRMVDPVMAKLADHEARLKALEGPILPF